MPVAGDTDGERMVKKLWNIPVAFHFEVLIGGDNDVAQCSFSEVSGLNATIKYDSREEMGYHTIEKKMLMGVSYSNLILKRGLLRGAALTKWFDDSIADSKLTTKNIVIRLLDEKGSSLVVWNILNAYPVSIKMSPFGGTKNELVIEEVELAYQSFTRQDTPIT